MKILLVSNGYGEDGIAVKLAQAILAVDPAAQIVAVPLVGGGLAYERAGIDRLISHRMLPSGGFLRTVDAVFRDLKSGVLGQLSRSRQVIRSAFTTADLTVCVGDVFCLAMGGWRNPGPVGFLPSAKSERFTTHSWVERGLIRRLARAVYARDSETAQALATHGLPARYLGNPMMDGLAPIGNDFGFDLSLPVVGILPGSRQEAIENLRRILGVVGCLADQKICGQFIVSVAPSFDLSGLADRVADIGWGVDARTGALKKAALTVGLSDQFADVVAVSDAVIGLAGTANEQAMQLGKPVIAFEGCGPQSTLQRFREQKKLMQEKLILVEGSSDQAFIAAMVAQTLSRPSEPDQASPVASDAAPKIVADLLRSSGLR